MATRGLDSPRGGGKIESRHILIIAMSEHHVDYMDRKGGHSVIMQGGGGGGFSPMCTSDSMDPCKAPGFWQTMISIAAVRKRYYSEIESCKSKPIDQIFQLFCVATRHEEVTTEQNQAMTLNLIKGLFYSLFSYTCTFFYRKDG